MCPARAARALEAKAKSDAEKAQREAASRTMRLADLRPVNLGVLERQVNLMGKLNNAEQGARALGGQETQAKPDDPNGRQIISTS